MLYRSVPQFIHAIYYDGENAKAVQDFCGPNPDSNDPLEYRFYVGPKGASLLAGMDGAQGWVHVPVGYWLVRSIDNPADVWPVDPEYFAGKYEETR